MIENKYKRKYWQQKYQIHNNQRKKTTTWLEYERWNGHLYFLFRFRIVITACITCAFTLLVHTICVIGIIINDFDVAMKQMEKHERAKQKKIEIWRTFDNCSWTDGQLVVSKVFRNNIKNKCIDYGSLETYKK